MIDQLGTDGWWKGVEKLIETPWGVYEDPPGDTESRDTEGQDCSVYEDRKV